MIYDNDTLRSAIRVIVAYNWADEARDYEECLNPKNENSPDGHVFLTLRDLAAWIGDSPYEGDEELMYETIAEARRRELRNPDLDPPEPPDAPDRYELEWAYLQAYRLINRRSPW